MANLSLIINSALGWELNCLNSIQGNFANGSFPGLVNELGQPVEQLDANTWGINYSICVKYCGAAIIANPDFDFVSFASSFNNWLLPWLALTAQLPFETDSVWASLMSLFLALGSPMLITYSLSMTITNRWWVRQRFKELWETANSATVQGRWPDCPTRIRSVQELLQEGQQVPLRASQTKGWFSSLMVSGENEFWWKHLRKSLNNTRRGYTLSFVAQMVSAAIAWLFTVIAAFRASLGDTTTALDIAAGSLWIWMIPVISGWIMVGTQSKSNSIPDALRQNQARRAIEPPRLFRSYTVLGEQEGILVKAGLTPQLHHAQTLGLDAPPKEYLEVPNMFGGSVLGDERHYGPVYNYARVFTWWQLAAAVANALECTLGNVARGLACQTGIELHDFRAQQQGAELNAPQANPAHQMPPHPGNAAHGLPHAHIQPQGVQPNGQPGRAPHQQQTYWDKTSDATTNLRAYTPWDRIPHKVYKSMLAASIIAFVVQGGTTGASILIAYLTPTVGLGCRSGGYLVYGVLAVVAWGSLLLSMLLSHAVMLRYQQEHVNNPSMDFRRESTSTSQSQTTNPPPQPNHYERTWYHAFLCSMAVLTRYFGKFIAVANGIWLILTSLFEIIGVYDNCWCKSNYFSLKEAGWVVLFKSPQQLQQSAGLVWGGGISMSIIICLFGLSFFFLGTRDPRDDG